MKKLTVILLFIYFNFTQVHAASIDDWQRLSHYKIKDGLAIDIDTGLMWMRCSIGQEWTGSTCSGKASKLNWYEAMKLPNKFEYSGYNDWRVPTQKELLSLRYCSSDDFDSGGCKGIYERPTIVQTVFVNTDKSAVVWSSSPFAFSSDGAWSIYFSHGFVSTADKSNVVQVRLVRSGQ